MKLLKLLNLKPLNFKLVAIISLIVALLAVYFLFFHHPIQDIPPEFENIGLKVEPLVFEGRRIHFPYTDDNNGENIIIKSDKKVYKGGDKSDVYFTVTNTGDKSEKIAILKYFPKEYGDINYVDVWNGDKWQEMPITRGDIKGNMTKLGKAFKKKKPVPERFDVKAGIQFEISAGHTAYFKAEITYPSNKEGEFWFEAFGDQGGYGLLDPIFVGGTTTSRDTPSGWYNSGGTWDYRKRITIDKNKVSGTSALSNFPVLIARTDSNFKHTSFGGNVASSSAGPTGGGGDFVFTSSDGTTKLDHEIEKYSSSSGEIIAWVEVPTLAVATDTVLYVYYGGPSSGATNQNRTGTWDSNFVGVWHLGEGDSTATSFYKDSTSNAEHGTMTDSDGDNAQVAGQIGNAMSFGADNADGISTTEDGAFTDFTTCAWFKDSSGAASYEAIVDRTVTLGYWIGRNDTTANSWGGGVIATAAGDSIAVTLTDGVWHQICTVRSGTTHYIYGDGGSVSSSETVPATALQGGADFVLNIGSKKNGNNASNASIDEVKASNSVRSSDWIKTEYTNQFKPSTFYGFGGQQSRTSSTTKIGQTTTSRDTPSGWYNSGGTWDYRRKITIDKSKVSGTSNLSNFPVLVNITYPDLRTTGFSGKLASGSGEFIFTSSDGTTSLPYEIETYSSSSGQFIGWVNVTTLSVTQDTAIYMYYGGPAAGVATNQNKTGTWNSNYVAVYHMNTDPSKTCRSTKELCDSTTNANDMDMNGTMTTSDLVGGPIGKAIDFDNTDDYFAGAAFTGGATTSQVTMQAWVRTAGVAAYDGIFENRTGNLKGILISGASGNPVTFTLDEAAGEYDAATGLTLTNNSWYYYSAALSSNAASLSLGDTMGKVSKYNDAVSNGSRDLNAAWEIGRDPNNTAARYWNGRLDEVRLVKVTLTAGWVKTEYTNQFKPSNFYGVGGLEKRN